MTAADLVTGTSRRRFLAYLLATPTLAVAVDTWLDPTSAQAVVPSGPQPAELEDLGDFLIQAQKPTESMMIVLTMGTDGKVRVDLPRMEVGQGITTSCAMIVADELDVPLEDVTIHLSPGRPELLYSQITGGSNTIRSVFEPLRQAAAMARGATLLAAAKRTGVPVSALKVLNGVVVGGGHSIPVGELSKEASTQRAAKADVKALADLAMIGTPQNRKDARAMVTGAFKYTNDMEPVPGILRAMVRRPPRLDAPVTRVVNEAAVKAMPGVRGIYVIPTGVAVVADTFGQALDGKEALVVEWGEGSVDGFDNAKIRESLRAVNVPLTPANPLATVVEGEFDFAFVSHAPMETNTAIADIKADGGKVWSGLKIPIVAAQEIEKDLGLPSGSVEAIVVQSGGSFGRRLFFDGALEAARISKAAGAPVKVMMTRVDDMRHGRGRAASHHLVRASIVANDVVQYEHHVASCETDWRHGLGEIVSAMLVQQGNPNEIPISVGGNMAFSQSVFYTTVKSPYNLGPTLYTLNETSEKFHTAAFRSVYSPNTRGADEIIVDEVAKALGKDPVAFRKEYLKDPAFVAVVEKCAELGDWGKAMPAGHAQGFAFHAEYKSCTACLVEMDATNPLKPRVTKATVVCDVGLPINPRGLQSQMLGGLTDAITTTLRGGLHFEDGLPLEGSYSQFHYARQKDSPREVTVHVMPARTTEPGGAGELGVAAAVGAVANAYARATKQKVRSFPLVFPVDFTPFTKGTGSTRVNPR